jgi:hypothetical protein
MPIYEYEHRKTGARVELFRTVHGRDCVDPQLRRVFTTSAPGLFTGKVLDPTSAAAAVPRAFKQLENQIPRREIERQSGFSTKQITQAWNFK